jgi:hypothetical protein
MPCTCRNSEAESTPRLASSSRHLLDLLLKDADNLQGSLDILQFLLPRVKESSSGPTQTQNFWIKRHPALLVATTVLSGVFITFMGWFTYWQLNNLRDQIGKVWNQQH